MSETDDLTQALVGRVTELLPRATFADISQWPGWDLADVDEGDETYVSVVMPEAWTSYTTTSETPVKVLRDAYGHARFAVLATGLVPINDEDAARY